MAVLATIVALGSILILNGNYISNPYGGGSLEGRFMWTLIPAMVAWSAVVVARWESAGRFLWTAGIAVGGVWVYEAIPILRGDHNYFNVFVEFPLWDPMAVPGWWSGLDRVLPTFDLPGQTFGSPALGLAFELGVAALVVIAAVHYARPAAFSRASLGAMGAIALLLVAAVALAGPTLPSTDFVVGSAGLSAPHAGGPTSTASVPVPVILPGAYRATLTYRLTGPSAAGKWALICVAADGTASSRSSTSLVIGTAATTLPITCRHRGSLESVLTITPDSDLVVNVLRIRKTAA
jgi:hypothetical protein